MTYQKITIPLDHGNRNMKTAEEVFTSGLAESDLKPVLGEYLQYNGKFYSDRKSTRLNSSHNVISRMPSSA